MTQAADVVVRRQIVVEAPIEQAFTVFTERFGDFKPPEHNLLGVADRRDGLRAEGRRSHHRPRRRRQRVPLGDASCAYEPPDRVVFSWDISPRWQVETDPEHASEVEVRFTAEGPQRTRVELEHRHLDRHGAGWESVRDGVADDQGWPLYLDRYAALFTTGG